MHDTARTGRHRIRRPVAVAVVALALWAVAPPLHAQSDVAAVPEFIELTEADLQTPLGVELAEAQAAFRAGLNEDPGRTLEIAKDIVALTREAFGGEHDHVSRALTNLAIVQAQNADFETAAENYATVIDTRERASRSILSGELVNPLLGLAGARMSLGDIDGAIPALERAIHICHVNEGPETLSQIEIVDALSRAHFFNGDLDKADELQDVVFRLRARRADDDPEHYLDALDYRARWYSRLHRHREATRFYRRLVRAISDRYGEEDPRLIQPLLSLADVSGMYTDRWGMFFPGRRALARAVRIARANADASATRLAMTLVDQGDWYTARYMGRYTRAPYQEAWQILNGDPALHHLRDQLFAAPVLILRSRLRPIYGVREGASIIRPERFTAEGYVDVTFDVDRLGRPRNARVVFADPAGLMDQHVRYQVRQFRYRPAYEDGRPRDFEGVSYRHTFRYDASALTDREKRRISTTTYAAGAQTGR